MEQCLQAFVFVNHCYTNVPYPISSFSHKNLCYSFLESGFSTQASNTDVYNIQVIPWDPRVYNGAEKIAVCIIILESLHFCTNLHIV